MQNISIYYTIYYYCLLIIKCSTVILIIMGNPINMTTIATPSIAHSENEDILTNFIYHNESSMDNQKITIGVNDQHYNHHINNISHNGISSSITTKILSKYTMTTFQSTIPETTTTTTPTPTTNKVKTTLATLLFQLTNITLLPSHNSPQFNNISAALSKLIGIDNNNNNNNNAQHKKLLPKIQRTDAPMLNYIFDSVSSANKHHHHDHRYGPHFEDISSVGNVTNITAQVGSAVYLNCRISLLQDKTVSWVRRKNGGESGLDLLTVGMHTYSGDVRYKMEFQYPNNWKLKIETVVKDDEGTYECQISTYPPRVIRINLFINDPKVIIINEDGGPLHDKYYEVDSTMQLSCIVRHVAMSTSVVYWSHGERILNYDISRGGVSVKTEVMEKGANSTLYIAKINKADSGNYTCSINASHVYTVLVHVLNGESFAELHHGSNSEKIFCISIGKLFLFLIGIYLIVNDIVINR